MSLRAEKSEVHRPPGVIRNQPRVRCGGAPQAFDRGIVPLGYISKIHPDHAEVGESVKDLLPQVWAGDEGMTAAINGKTASVFRK
jgi:hypothetical protein